MKNKLKFLAMAPMAALATMACGPSTDSFDIVISAFGTEFLSEGDDWHAILEEETGLRIRVVHHDDNEGLETSMETTDYDIIMPSEYMAAKMHDDEKLETIDWSLMTSTKQEAIDALDDSSKATNTDLDLLDYAMPYARGDIRVHLNDNYDNGACASAVEAVSKDGTVDGGFVDVDVFFTPVVYAACDTAILDDDRNITLLTALYDAEKGSEVPDPNKVNNPLLTDLNVDTIKLLSANSNKVAEETLSENFADGDYGLVLSYNTDPLWIFDYTDSPSFDISSMNLGSASNLWIDTIAMTADASDEAYAVFNAMYENMADSSAVYNWYNSPYKAIEADLEAEITAEFGELQQSFVLQDQVADYYGTIKYDGPGPTSDKSYNADISEWVQTNWS